MWQVRGQGRSRLMVCVRACGNPFNLKGVEGEVG
jgi:hypothetical protein